MEGKRWISVQYYFIRPTYLKTCPVSVIPCHKTGPRSGDKEEKEEREEKKMKIMHTYIDTI